MNRRIFGATMTIALMTVLVKAATAGRELVVAWRFGTVDVLDAFFIALVVPTFILNIVTGSFNYAFIPVYIRVREREGAAEAQQLFHAVTIWSTRLLALTTLLIVLAAPLYLPLIGSEFGPEKLRLTVQLLYLLAPLVLFSGMGIIRGAVLNAGERFALAALLPIVTPLVSILFLLMGRRWGIFALAAGMVCGAVLEWSLLSLALKRQGVSLWPGRRSSSSRNSFHLREVAGQYAPMAAGSLLMSGTIMVDQAMAAMLPRGSVAAFNYGTRIAALLLAVGAMALNTALVPYFSAMVARQDWTGVRGTLRSYLKLVFIITVPLTILVALFSRPLVALLFQRGSFTAEDTIVVARVQAFFILQAPFFVAGVLVIRLISSMRANHILMWGAAINLTANVALNFLFIKWLGVAGIALSTSIVYLLSLLYCGLMLQRMMRALPPRSNPAGMERKRFVR